MSPSKRLQEDHKSSLLLLPSMERYRGGSLTTHPLFSAILDLTDVSAHISWQVLLIHDLPLITLAVIPSYQGAQAIF